MHYLVKCDCLLHLFVFITDGCHMCSAGSGSNWYGKRKLLSADTTEAADQAGAQRKLQNARWGGGGWGGHHGGGWGYPGYGGWGGYPGYGGGNSWSNANAYANAGEMLGCKACCMPVKATCQGSVQHSCEAVGHSQQATCKGTAAALYHFLNNDFFQ
jgi:hypothetical protein